jgi:hypothetical protein
MDCSADRIILCTEAGQREKGAQRSPPASDRDGSAFETAAWQIQSGLIDQNLVTDEAVHPNADYVFKRRV